MNTKSMVLILNGLLLFNTVSHGFSMSSWRKKVVDTCVSLGRKSIAVVCVMVLVLLSAISLQGALLIDRGRKVTRAWNSSHAMQGSQRSSQNPRPFQGSQVMHSDQRPRSAESPAALPGAQHRWALVTAASVPAAGVTAACRGRDQWGFPSIPPNRTGQSSQEESEEEISSEDEEIHAFPKELQGSCEKQGDIVVHHPDKPNLLETLPIELVQLITQMIHHKSWVHAGSFQDQWFHQDEVLAKGEEPKEWLDSKKSTSINFIDGDPQKLELALRPSYKRHSAGYTVPTVDAITLDTRTFSQRIEVGKEVDFNYSEHPTSYYQRGIISPGDKKFIKHNTGILPLRRQVNFIDAFNAHMFGWHHDNSPYIDSHGSTTYDGVSYVRASPEERMSLGIQRNLLGERIIWFRAKGNKVGIYEKAMKWYDESGALDYPGFESVLKDREPDGDEFHLVQVVEEPTPVRTISLPHTPVYLKDKDGNEIVGCCTTPPVDSTAHLRSPSDYPQDLDIFALGFSAEETDTRVSLYKQLGDNPAAYNPRLLVNQLSPTTPDPDKIEMLYPNEHPSVMDYFRYADLSAQAYVATKLGRRKPRAIP